MIKATSLIAQGVPKRTSKVCTQTSHKVNKIITN